ncbi:hypothetical protein EIH07_05040 [Chryseobacterium taklimakanense]|uniref:hypothetical protein n=1 Tax=Chryseobacterium taklimakanense TaxID=536441 RepID=UPI000F5FC422|nr:hypothetical protein [Chryseobacterium taklimakanense]AZI22451.1 hypothetical protein EIH07_05040 [Chryseobacterium taklimakanense]
MKKILLIIIFYSMSTNIFSQSLPIAVANVTKTGITYSYSETSDAIAISLAYGESSKIDVIKKLKNTFPKIEDNTYTLDNQNLYFIINEINNSTKIDLKLKQTHNSKEEFNEIQTKIKHFFKSIVE